MSGLIALFDDVAAIAKVAAASVDDVIGQAANLAARLEAYGKDDPLVARTPEGEIIDCRVLVSEDSASLLNGRYNLEPLGEANLRGARDKMKIYRLPTTPVMETLQGGSK